QYPIQRRSIFSIVILVKKFKDNRHLFSTVDILIYQPKQRCLSVYPNFREISSAAHLTFLTNGSYNPFS
ncbi:hypothetical protein, partial [Peribacillus frigoritolerans]|uniref:hypothetical protein n=1 Tax=Peribacillus frigoritolerans TaxID=450367 RepID=UPI0020BF5611